MRKMYVGNIPYNATEEDLRELFSEYGEIESLKIIQDQDTGRSKGFGFIEMAEEKDTRKAIEELNGKDFMQKTLKVSEARPQQKRGGFNRGGDYGGGYGGGRGTGRGWR
jgi:RNA recognition motif-containing protein